MTIAKTLKQVLLLAIIGVMLSACAQPFRGPLYAQAPAPPASSEQATLYILRVTSPWFGYPVNRYRVADREAATLTDREFTWLTLSPGQHTIQARGYGAIETLDIDAKAGETHYVIFELRNRDHGRFFSHSDSTRIVRATFEEVTAERARIHLGNMSYSPSIF